MTHALSPVRSGVLDQVNGLPTHPLVVHFAVGLVILAALVGLVAALAPRRRPFLVPWSAVVSVLAAVFCVLATQSGESLEERVGRSRLVEEHAELGEQTRTIALVLAALTIVWWLVDRARRHAQEAADAAARVQVEQRERVAVPDSLFADRTPGPHTPTDDAGDPSAATRLTASGSPRRGGALGVVSTVLAVCVLVTSLLAGTWVYRAGEAGARSVWHDTPASAGR